MKGFIVTDKSDRSAKPYTLTELHLRKHWDLFEQDNYTEKTLQEYLDDCEVGDEWNTNAIEILHIL